MRPALLLTVLTPAIRAAPVKFDARQLDLNTVYQLRALMRQVQSQMQILHENLDSRISSSRWAYGDYQGIITGAQAQWNSRYADFINAMVFMENAGPP